MILKDFPLGRLKVETAKPLPILYRSEFFYHLICKFIQLHLNIDEDLASMKRAQTHLSTTPPKKKN